MDRNAIHEITAALFIMVVAVWFVPVAAIVVASLIYLPTLLLWWYKRERKQRERS